MSAYLLSFAARESVPSRLFDFFLAFAVLLVLVAKTHKSGKCYWHFLAADLSCTKKTLFQRPFLLGCFHKNRALGLQSI